MSVKSAIEPAVEPMIPGLLTDPSLDLRAGPVDVPLELRIPSLQINAPIVGVGITADSVMDAPKGLADDPVWQKTFWYRGSGIPGDSGTATFAGHVDDVLGRPAVFAHLRELRSGDLIVVHDTRSGLDVRFTIVKIATYSARQAADPAVLAQIYGDGPVSGKGPQPAPDGRAHLTLITCAGGFVNGSYDRRLVVYATRSESKRFQFRWKYPACSTSADGPTSCWF
jgi:sortase (surface protein transpeptidase)